MAIVLTLGREVMQMICAYELQSKRPHAEKFHFYHEGGSKRDFRSSSEIIVSLGDFNGHVGKCAEGFEGVYKWNGIGETNAEEKRLVEFCDDKDLCMTSTWFNMKNKTKITYSAGGCETEIDFVLVGEKYRKYIKDVKVIPWELQHRQVVVDLDKKGCKKATIHKKIRS